MSRRFGTVLLLLSMISSAESHARGYSPESDTQDIGISLSLSEVLDSVLVTHPSLAAADAKLEASRAKSEGARGVWDPKLKVSAFSQPLGTYTNGQFATELRQQTPLWGLQAFAGYRISWGKMPAYQGDLETPANGEVVAGFLLPLWRGRSVDQGRADLQKYDNLYRSQSCDRDETSLEIQAAAANAYWNWVEQGLIVGVQEELLNVAVQRNQALTDGVEHGTLAPIVLVDNQRLVYEREGQLVAAERDFNRARIELSQYLRDQLENPIEPDRDRLPPGSIVDATERANPLLPPQLNRDSIQDAVQRRPEMCRLQQALAASNVQVRLAKNDVAPQIDAKGYVTQGWESAQNAVPTELNVGISIELPLALRKARGALRSARAEQQRLEAELRKTRDRIAADIAQSENSLQAAMRQLHIAQLQLDASQTLAAAERDRFKQGASDLVIVNLREQAQADAARKRIERFSDYQRAHIAYLRVLGRAPLD